MPGLVYFSILLTCLIALVAGAMLLLERRRLLSLIIDRGDHAAIQASHQGDPLRFGGVVIFLGLILGATTLALESGGEYSLALLLSTIPVLLAGLIEDSGRRVSPQRRLLAAMFSALLAAFLLNLWPSRADIAGIDWLLGIAPIAILVTILFAGGFCHAMNLIDGMNGLAAITIILSALGIATIAGEQELAHVSMLAYLLAAGTFGFFLLNWPVSRLMLGDAGAYGLGHMLVWLMLSTAALSPAAIPALLLVLFWPLADLFHTMLRRFGAGKKLFEPDKMHLHQKIRRGLEIMLFGAGRRGLSNPLTTLLLTPCIAAPILTGVLLHQQPNAAWAALAGYSVLFAATHLVVVSIARRWRSRPARRPAPHIVKRELA